MPPTAAYFPVSAYSASTLSGPPQQTMVLEAVGTAMDSADGATQPNTPDLLIHRRQVCGLWGKWGIRRENVNNAVLFMVAGKVCLCMHATF